MIFLVSTGCSIFKKGRTFNNSINTSSNRLSYSGCVLGLELGTAVRGIANRYENNHQPEKWHDKELQKIWKNIKENTDVEIKRWP